MTLPLAEPWAGLQRVALDTAVSMTESISVLPAVATQNWCDLAGAVLLPLGRWTYVGVLLGVVDEHGRITRHEATGVAGGRIAAVTTTLGRTVETQSMVSMDPNELALAGLRAALAQGKELSWSPGKLSPYQPRVGSPEELAGPNWRQSALGRRWARVIGGVESSAVTLWLGAVMIPGVNPRTLVVEIGLKDRGPIGDGAGSVLEAVLRPLAHRAFAAVGPGASDSTMWLTTKEQNVLNYLLAGESVREIAGHVGRSMHTVHDHVKSLHRKLGARTRGELIARALGHLPPSGAEPPEERESEPATSS